MDDIVRTAKGNPGVVFEAANKLHPNLQFTIEGHTKLVEHSCCVPHLEFEVGFLMF